MQCQWWLKAKQLMQPHKQCKRSWTTPAATTAVTPSTTATTKTTATTTIEMAAAAATTNPQCDDDGYGD